jgi:hypothetical protein
VRDRDGSYGPDFGRLLQSVGTEEILIAPRAPWQNPKKLPELRRALHGRFRPHHAFLIE